MTYTRKPGASGQGLIALTVISTRKEEVFSSTKPHFLPEVLSFSPTCPARRGRRVQPTDHPYITKASGSAMDDAALRFFDTVRMDDSCPNPTWIEQRLQAELPQLRATLGDGAPLNVCPLVDIGEYLLGISQILSQFADKLVNGNSDENLIREYAKAQLGHLADSDDGSATVYLDEKQAALKCAIQSHENLHTGLPCKGPLRYSCKEQPITAETHG
jgi:hypothetical protein